MRPNELSICNPKLGWAYAEDRSVNSKEEALEIVQNLLKQDKKLQFALVLDNKTYWYKNGDFVR